MKKIIVSLLVVCLLLITSLASVNAYNYGRLEFEVKIVDDIGNEGKLETLLGNNPDEIWTKTFGGKHTDKAWCVQQTSDSGYILTGVTGDWDIWLIKTDEYGNEQWNRSFNSGEMEAGYSVQQTSDDGYILTGYIGPLSDFDIWLIKTDADGNMIWDRTFGGPGADGGLSVQQTSDGGYIISGGTSSYGNGEGDVWLIKTDSNGNEEWNRTFGGSKGEGSHSSQQTNDGGYVITGYTGNGEVWLIKTDSNGNEEWNRTFENGMGTYVQQTNDGGYIIGAVSATGDDDVWLIKTDSNGNEEWNKTYGGAKVDRCWSLQQTIDHGYILTGYSASYGDEKRDLWLIKTDSNGELEWDRLMGGKKTEEGQSVQQTSDGGYIITGFTESFGVGMADVWLLKTDEYGYIPPNPPTIDGPRSGDAGVEYDYTFVALDPDGDDIASYTIDWGDDNVEVIEGPFASGEEVIVSHTWDEEEKYTIRAKAKDVHDLESDWSELTVSIGNHLPTAPEINGPITGEAGVEYTYDFCSTDPDGDDIASYTIDWGDDNVEAIDGPFASGEEVIVSHTWSETGTYTIRAKAKDIYDAESDWGYLEVEMPVNYQISQQSSNPLFFQILQILINTR